MFNYDLFVLLNNYLNNYFVMNQVFILYQIVNSRNVIESSRFSSFKISYLRLAFIPWHWRFFY